MDSSLISDRIREYVQRVQSRPAYVRGLEKGPDYKYGKLCARGLIMLYRTVG